MSFQLVTKRSFDKEFARWPKNLQRRVAEAFLALRRLCLSVEGVLLGIQGRDRQFNWLFHKTHPDKGFSLSEPLSGGSQAGKFRQNVSCRDPRLHSGIVSLRVCRE